MFFLNAQIKCVNESIFQNVMSIIRILPLKVIKHIIELNGDKTA